MNPKLSITLLVDGSGKFTLSWKIAKTSIFYLSVLYQSRTAVQLDFGRTLRYWIRANGLYNYLEKTYDIS